MLKKKYRLRKNVDFKKVYEENYSIPTRTLVLFSIRTDRIGEPRIGFSVSKRIGNSVVRNKTRRLLREAIRPYIVDLLPGSDFVIIARKPIVDANIQQIRKDIIKVLKRSGYLGK